MIRQQSAPGADSPRKVPRSILLLLDLESVLSYDTRILRIYRQFYTMPGDGNAWKRTTLKCSFY